MVTKKNPVRPRPTVKRKSRGRRDRSTPVQTLLDDLLAIAKTIPGEELDKLPRDLAQNFDEYLESGFPER